jgi:hypothetical protein
MTTFSPAHTREVWKQSAKILELHERYHLRFKDLARRYSVSWNTIENIVKAERKKRLPPAAG